MTNVGIQRQPTKPSPVHIGLGRIPAKQTLSADSANTGAFGSPTVSWAMRWAWAAATARDESEQHSSGSPM